MKGVQCYEFFGEIALKYHAFFTLRERIFWPDVATFWQFTSEQRKSSLPYVAEHVPILVTYFSYLYVV